MKSSHFSKKKFHGLVFARPIDSDQFTDAMHAFNVEFSGDLVKRWDQIDIFQGKMSIDPPEIVRKKALVEQHMATIAVDTVAELRSSVGTVDRRGRVGFYLQGPGTADLRSERRRIAQLSGTDITSIPGRELLFVTLGGMASHGASTSLGLAHAVQAMAERLPSRIEVGELGVEAR